MPSVPIGNVDALSPDDKFPGIYLQNSTETGSSEGIPYLLVVGAIAADGAALTADTDVVDILDDTDALYYAGANSEGYRMLMRALSVGGVKIKYAAAAITAGTQAEATITIDTSGAITTTGSIFFRFAGRPVGPIGISLTDTPHTIADAIAAFINADPLFAGSAAVASGSGTTYVITLTAGSDGARGNSLTIWKDLTNTPSEVTAVLAGGSSLTSGGKYFHLGAGTETMTNLMTSLAPSEYFTNAIAQRDSTNLAAWETATNTKLGPLVGRLENIVTCAVGTLSASGSLAQTTLNHSSFEMLWMEECETPGEEIAALFAAARHRLEITMPNRRYDIVKLDGIQPQEAKSKQPSRPTCVAALNYGLTPIETTNNAAFLVRAVTSRTQTDTGGTDDGTVDVAQWRVALEFRRVLKLFLEDHMAKHEFVLDNPAEGDEPDVPTGNTYPNLIADEVWKLEYEKQNDNWLAQVAQNRPQCALHPTASTPRPILYAPIVPKPLLHQIAGTVALRKFQVAASA